MKQPKLGDQSFLRDDPSWVDPFDGGVEATYGKEAVGELYTGRHFLIRKDGRKGRDEIKKILESKWGFSVADTADFVTDAVNENAIRDADALIYNELGITLLGVEEEPEGLMESLDADYFIEPEKVVYVPDDIPEGTDLPATSPATWGIEITRVIDSRYTGEGIGVAVLDSGFDTTHPDFKGRAITSRSFVPDETRDRHGHGTHCTGIACGSADGNGRRYGVATRARIFAGKVLSDRGGGAQAWVLNGMTWAANNGCKVISMSLGSRVAPGKSYDIAYERAAQFAFSKGSVIVAAAGNDSRRSENEFSPVASPADSPSILAVGALDRDLNVANFSNRAINPWGKVDIAAPGVAIYSSWPMPAGYRTISGTSMATPHVAGIIALLFEKYPDATPHKIWSLLKNMTKVIPVSPADAGAGLVIAP